MKRVFSFNRIVVTASMLAAVGIVGCSSGQPTVDDEDEVVEESAALQDSADAEEAATAEESAGKGERRGRRGPGGHGMRGGAGMGGPAMFLFRAAEDLDLTDAQKATLEAIREGMKPADGERGPRPEKVAELAAAIRKGSVDAAALAASDGAGDPMKEHHAKVVAAVQKLHDTLTPAQRVQLVADMRAKVAEHAGDVPKGPEGGRKDGEARGPHGGKTLFMLHGLDVSDAQEAKITAALDDAGLGPSDAPEPPDFDAMRAQAEAALTAFAKDGFVAATSLPAPPAGAKTGRGPRRFVEALAVIVPLLDADQREALAKRVEEGPTAHHGRKGPRGQR